MSTTLKSLLRDRTPPILMDGRKDGTIVLYWPAELKSTRLRIVDDKGMTIPIGPWMSSTRAGIPDWERKYYAASSLIMMANNSNGFSAEHSLRWDAAFFLGIMWERFRKKRGARVEVTEETIQADEMDAIVKRINRDG
jgi:hypothetical protein